MGVCGGGGGIFSKQNKIKKIPLLQCFHDAEPQNVTNSFTDIHIWTILNYCLCWYSWSPNEQLILHLLLYANICILTKSSYSGSVCRLHIYLSIHADERIAVGQGTFTTGTQPHRLQLCGGARTEGGSVASKPDAGRLGGALRAPREMPFYTSS